MSQLRKQMIEDLELGGYAETTRRNYVGAIQELAEYYRRSPAKLSREELRTYVTHLRETRCKSASRLRGHLSAIRFLYTKTRAKTTRFRSSAGRRRRRGCRPS